MAANRLAQQRELVSRWRGHAWGRPALPKPTKKPKNRSNCGHGLMDKQYPLYHSPHQAKAPTSPFPRLSLEENLPKHLCSSLEDQSSFLTKLHLVPAVLGLVLCGSWSRSFY